MKKLSFKKIAIIISSVLVLAGSAVVLPAFYFDYSHKGTAAGVNLEKASRQSKKPQNGTLLVTGHPKNISIPSVNINLPVIDGYYDSKSGEWTLTNDKAQYATPTVEPNNISGNTFIYGHALTVVFGRLTLIKPGAEVTITTDNGYAFKYKFIETYATQPTDTSVLRYQGPPILTLQTCSGSFWQNRQMYIFSLEVYEKA
jgi:LPXTG-site transpeptidase (sortase) family protein